MNKLSDEHVVVISSIIATLADEGGNAPEGIMYAAVMNGISLSEFNAIMVALDRAGLITRSGNIASLTPKGLETAERIKCAITATITQ